MRKLIAVASFSFAVWFVVTFAWAAAAHVTGLPGPARASAASLELASQVVTLADPPGVLGAPQRFASRQLSVAARMAKRLHRGPERAVARGLDRLGHAGAHGHRRLHERQARAIVRVRGVRAPDVRIDAMDRARIEIRNLDRLERAERASASGLRSAERARNRAERHRKRALERAERFRERAAASVERFEVEADRADGGGVKREIERRIEEILRDLRREMAQFEIEMREFSLDIDR